MSDRSPQAGRGAFRYPDELGFRLDGFLRISWASVQARDNWASRLHRIRETVRESEWQSVVNGERTCALVSGNHAQLSLDREQWAACGLCWHELRQTDNAMARYWVTERAAARPGSTQTGVVARDDQLADFVTAWRKHDHDVVGAMLGIPGCCVTARQEIDGDGHMLDPTWAYAQRDRPVMGGNTLTISAEDTLTDTTNTLWRWLGARGIPYLPCRPDCAATAQLGEIRQGERRSGAAAEAWEWLTYVLSWPVEWTALHGIAEVKTPILKFCTATDATAAKYTVRWMGRSYPADGAVGLGFPYRRARGGRSLAVGIELQGPTGARPRGT